MKRVITMLLFYIMVDVYPMPGQEVDIWDCEGGELERLHDEYWTPFVEQVTDEEEYWDVAAYTKHAERHHTMALVAIKDFIFSEADEVLDIGCGDGLVTNFMAKKVACVVGIDQSKAMIDHAQAHYAKSEGDNGNVPTFLPVHAQNILRSGVAQRPFDVITSFLCLPYIENSEKSLVLRTMFHALKPGGSLIVTTSCFTLEHPVFAVHTATHHLFPTWKKELKGHYYIQDPYSYYKEVLTSLGFCNINLERKDFPFYFDHKEHFETWLKNWAFSWNNTKKLTEDEQNIYFDTFFRAYYDCVRIAVPDMVLFTFCLLVITAEKPK